jgi:hypothetical protein
MGFQDRAYETQLAKAAWWLQLADYWNERDPKFAELLRTKAREIQKADDAKAKSFDQRPAGLRRSNDSDISRKC